MPIETLDPANSILFLGSGFSAGATNIANQKVPAGNPLRKSLAEALGEDPEDLDLKSAADEFLSRKDLSLYDLLYETFTISEVLPFQREVLSWPWARIYTTNYDDIINVVKGPQYPIFTFDSPRRRPPPSFAVHLHGSIRMATEANADSQLILNSRSYDVITRQFPDWFNEFQRDRRSFDACYFMGFSLADHHIAGLMAAGEESVKRTYFIAQTTPKPAFVRRASEFGEVVPIGFEGFAALIRSLPKPQGPRDLSSLQSFKYLHPGVDAKPLAPPTPVEIYNLVAFGKFNPTRYFNTPLEHRYVAGRELAVDVAITSLKSHKTVLVHSHLGNGKSIFVFAFSDRASNEGYKCFLWRRAARRLSEDLEVLSSMKRVTIIFDDYDAAIENIERIAASLPDAKFIVTVRTAQHEVRLHEIVQKLPGPVKRLNINALNDTDKDQLLAILDRAGARPERLEETVRSAREIRDVVTSLYDHSEIRKELSKAVSDVPAEVSRILILSCLIRWAGVSVDDTFLQEVTDRDVYADLRKSRGIADEFLELTDDKVSMRSAVLSEYLITRIFGTEELLRCCYDLTITSVRRKSDRAQRRLAAELMKFSTLQRFLRMRPGADSAIEKHYVRLSRDVAVNDEPLFWLQYAILMKHAGEIANARQFLNTGYQRAKDGFKTFQLDTQALSIYLLEEISRQSDVVEGLEGILASIRTVTDMIADQSHRQYAIEVIGEIPAFVDARRSALTNGEKVALVFELNRATQALAALPVDEQAYTGSEIVRANLASAVSKLTGPILS